MQRVSKSKTCNKNHVPQLHTKERKDLQEKSRDHVKNKYKTCIPNSSLEKQRFSKQESTKQKQCSLAAVAEEGFAKEVKQNKTHVFFWK